MERIDKELVLKLARDLMFDLNDEECDLIVENSVAFVNQIKDLHDIDVSGIDVMSYPFEAETDWLREDVVDHVVDVETIFENAPHRSGDFFKTVKVVQK